MTKSQRRVLLVVPRPIRDLEGHALVAYHLKRRFDHDVHLWTGVGTDRQMLDYKPDIVVLDVVGFEDRLQEARLAKNAGAKVCVLPTAGVFPDEKGLLRLAGAFNGGCELVDCYLAWGKVVADAVVGQRLMSKERVEMTGCPRFDFYADESIAGLQDRSTFLQCMGIRDVEAPVVLWSTSTSNYNRRSGHLERYIRHLTRNNGFSESDVRVEIEDERRQLETHSRIVLELADRSPEWNFLVKVHPLENRRFYTDWARGARNIFIAPNIPIKEFVFHCDVLLQRGCTTAIEFWTQGKPVLELQMGEFQTVWAPLEQAQGNHSVFTVDETARVIADYLEGKPVPSSQREARNFYLEKYYHRVDGKAARRCAERIHREITGETYTDAHQKRTCEMFRAIEDRNRGAYKRDLRNTVRRTLGIAPDRTLRPWRRSFWSASVGIDQKWLATLYDRYDRAMNHSEGRNADNVPIRSAGC